MLSKLVRHLAFMFYRTNGPKEIRKKHYKIFFNRWFMILWDCKLLRWKRKIKKVIQVLRKINRVIIQRVNVNEYTKSKSFKTQLIKKERKLDVNVHTLYISQTNYHASYNFKITPFWRVAVRRYSFITDL